MEFLIVLLISAFAGLMQASVGFGFAVVFTPLLSLAMGPREAIALSLVLSVTLSLALYIADTPRASMREVMPMFLAAVVASPIGVYILAVADERVLRADIGVAVLTSVVGTLFMPHSTTERPERMSLTLLAGVISGIFRGATSMGGPPVVVYEHWRGASPLIIRRRLVAFFALTGVAGLLIAAPSGVLTQWTFIQSIAGLPAVAIALYGGRYIRPRLSDRWFRWISMALLVFMGVVSLVGAIRG